MYSDGKINKYIYIFIYYLFYFYFYLFFIFLIVFWGVTGHPDPMGTTAMMYIVYVKDVNSQHEKYVIKFRSSEETKF